MERPTINPRWLGLRDAAAYTGLSVPTLRKLIREGRLKAYRPTRRINLNIGDLDRLMEGGKEGGT